jgi:hypothetical protein
VIAQPGCISHDCYPIGAGRRHSKDRKLVDHPYHQRPADFRPAQSGCPYHQVGRWLTALDSLIFAVDVCAHPPQRID